MSSARCPAARRSPAIRFATTVSRGRAVGLCRGGVRRRRSPARRRGSRRPTWRWAPAARARAVLTPGLPQRWRLSGGGQQCECVGIASRGGRRGHGVGRIVGDVRDGCDRELGGRCARQRVGKDRVNAHRARHLRSRPERRRQRPAPRQGVGPAPALEVLPAIARQLWSS